MRVTGAEYDAKIRDMIEYDPATGVFRWLIKTHGHGGMCNIGDVVGQRSDQGYWFIGAMGRLVRAHRLAWFFMTGAWPPKGFDVDHKDTIRDHNWWSNLRLATRSQTNMNGGLRKCNTSGKSGVSPRRGKWHARITVNGKIIILGDFAEKADAVAARRAAEMKHFGEFAVKDPSRRAIARHSDQPAGVTSDA